MSIGAALNIGTQGMLNGMNRTAIAAGKIAGGITEDPDAAGTMIGLSQTAKPLGAQRPWIPFFLPPGRS